MPPQHLPPSPYVFLSYTSTERDRALAVADALEQAGVPVWIDRAAIAGGTSWSDEIVEGIRNCTALVICCSPRAMQSRNVKPEIQLAWRYEKPYLPLLLEPVEFPQQVQYFLEGWQWVELLDRPEPQWLPDVLKALSRLGVSATGVPRGGCTGERRGGTGCGPCWRGAALARRRATAAHRAGLRAGGCGNPGRAA